ncbi:UBP-type zinc finger domain-containing protein [Novosphingobium sp. PhB57]|nr:UBP-type zinc finger domain-containing protein [Novosphingobium sp. PhB57]
MCLSCGPVGSCDQSPHRHAAVHFHTMGHPNIEGYDPPDGAEAT